MMQKWLLPLLGFLMAIAINVGITRYMLNDQVSKLDIPKIVVLDMTKVIERLSVNGRSPQQVLADSQNLMALLKLRGVLAVDSASVLGSGVNYELPEFKIEQVESHLADAGVPILKAADMEDRFQKVNDKINKDFGF